MKGAPMEITEETVSHLAEVIERFVGGQLEVQNRNEDYLYRGEISSIELDGEGDSLKLVVGLAWFAKMEMDFQWHVVEPTPYEIGMLIYSVSVVSDGRLFLSSWITGENTTLFPPGDSRLKPEQVQGLVLA